MEKEEIFSKLNLKNYNNQLEKIIEKKAFSEDTKNLLLSMLYKIGVGYEDYNKVKRETMLKREIFEEILDIVEFDCDEINLIRPTLEENEILKDKKSIGIKEERRIITYPNERAVAYALYTIRKQSFKINNDYMVIKSSLENLLNIGNNTDITEIIRDYDGWSWNNNLEDIEDLRINLVYQMIKYLVGNVFLQNWIINSQNIDYIKEFKKRLTDEYDYDLGEQIYKLICQISILIYTEKDLEEKKYLIKEQKRLEQEIEKMRNKKEYLEEIAQNKKEIEKRIRQIDKNINNVELLKEEFAKNNENLGETKEAFSLSDFSENQIKERYRLIADLKMYNDIMEPMKFVEIKGNMEEKIDILLSLHLGEHIEAKVNDLLIILHKTFLKAFEIRIKKLQIKQEAVDLIYELRYYKFIPIKRGMFVKDIEEIKQEIDKMAKLLVSKCCKGKVINIISQDIKINFELISNIFNTRLIDLDEITIEISQEKDKTVFNMYDDNTIDISKEYDYIKDLNIKPNKKIKLFL